MINNKPNAVKPLLLTLISFIGFLGCNTNESLTFEKHRFDSNLLENCNTSTCAKVEINLIQFINHSTIAMNINKELESVACSILNSNENEPEKTIEDAIRTFNLSFQQINDAFADEMPPYEATIDSELSYQNNTIISILLDSYILTGGAHGYGGVSYININPKTGERISNQRLIKNEADFSAYAEQRFRQHYNIPENESINSTGFFFENDIFALPAAIGIHTNEVILFYNPYEINSYADGPIELRLKKEEVAKYFAIAIL